MSELQASSQARGDRVVRPLVRRSPGSRIAAGLVGATHLDIVPAVGAVDDAGAMLQVPGAGGLAWSRDRVRALRDVAWLGVRPEHWLMTPGAGADGLHARVERVETSGELTQVHCRLHGADSVAVTVRTAWPGAEALPRGLRVRLEVRPWDLVLFDAEGRVLVA